ncbi:transposase [Streptoalloteichus tenebrarius]|uniref:transposase n=1 Tax=Streptoalloteichus tenebrarius (strain ATCC 17920 / DSM 40477 / JCM 4838 / CBS 697.72 / NBRC 16177 / NCIMB 11028 / NRRL B-12390 / A12253. 1 / ISP 5477) TaxID=1933 RepID=UPI003555F84B
MRGHELTDEQWQAIEPLLPASGTKGRPRGDGRRVINGIAFQGDDGWRDVTPERHGPGKRCRPPVLAVVTHRNPDHSGPTRHPPSRWSRSTATPADPLLPAPTTSLRRRFPNAVTSRPTDCAAAGQGGAHAPTGLRPHCLPPPHCG